MSLADRVIKANEEPTDPNPQKYDDIGFPLPKPDTERAWCEYLTARILYLNKRMYKHHNLLWLHDELITENKNTYYRLAKYPKSITDPECEYVWRRLKEIVPELDPDIISVLPGMTFNMRTGEVKFEEVPTTSSWYEED